MTDTSPQAPGLYRRRIGDLVVTAVNDGVGQLPFGALKGITEDDAKALLAQVFQPPAARTTIGGYLVQGGGRTVLIDTGAATAFGPTAGFLHANLAAAGVRPGDIDLVLLTHLHVDHFGGLTKDGAALFPNAAIAMSEGEKTFWLDPDPASLPEGLRGNASNAQAALAPYKNRITVLGQEAAPGITPVPLPGHTQGHTGFRIGDGNDALLIWGDVIHLQDIQAPRPDVGMVFDTHPEVAISTRKRLLDMAATDRLLVAGMHLHFPTFHHVARAGEGYALLPEMWTTVV